MCLRHNALLQIAMSFTPHNLSAITRYPLPNGTRFYPWCSSPEASRRRELLHKPLILCWTTIFNRPMQLGCDSDKVEFTDNRCAHCVSTKALYNKPRRSRLAEAAAVIFFAREIDAKNDLPTTRQAWQTFVFFMSESAANTDRLYYEPIFRTVSAFSLLRTIHKASALCCMNHYHNTPCTSRFRHRMCVANLPPQPHDHIFPFAACTFLFR